MGSVYHLLQYFPKLTTNPGWETLAMAAGSEDWLVRPVNSQIIADHFATKVEVPGHGGAPPLMLKQGERWSIYVVCMYSVYVANPTIT